MLRKILLIAGIVLGSLAVFAWLSFQAQMREREVAAQEAYVKQQALNAFLSQQQAETNSLRRQGELTLLRGQQFLNSQPYRYGGF